MHFPNLIYDFADVFPHWESTLAPLIFVFVGIGIYLYSKRRGSEKKVLFLGVSKRKHGMIFGLVFASLTGVVWVFLVSSTLVKYFRTKEIYSSGTYKTLEGTVQNFHPMPEGGHDSERFDVNGVPFEFSDYDGGDYGYNNTASHGGAIKEGLVVKIAYFNNGEKNVILRLHTQ